MTFRFEEQLERECRRKHRYANVREAEADADRLARAYGQEYRTYQCIWCHGAHLTSSHSTDHPTAST